MTAEEKRFDGIVPERGIILEMIPKEKFIKKETKSGIIVPDSAEGMSTSRQINTLIDHPYQGIVKAAGVKCDTAKVGMIAYVKYPHIFRTQHVNAPDTIIEQPVGMELYLDGIEYRHMGEYEVLFFKQPK